MRIDRVFDFVNILSNNKNFQVTLNTRFRLLRGFFRPLLLTPGKDIKLSTMSVACCWTNHEAEFKVYFHRIKCNNKNGRCKTV